MPSPFRLTVSRAVTRYHRGTDLRPTFSAGNWIHRGARLLTILLAGWIAASCTRSAIPYPGAVLPSTLTAAALVTRIPPPPFTGLLAAASLHAVFDVPEGERLSVRQVAGVEGSAAGTIAYDRRGLLLTGQQTSLGSSLWVEVVRPEGGTGWVNALNLVEDVPSESFCADPRVLQLLDAAARAVDREDGELLGSLVSPRRHLRIRYDWRSYDVLVSRTEIPDLFGESQERTWGVNASGATIRGSFGQVIMPLLRGTLTPASVLTCDSIGAGPTLREVRWPSEFTNLHYYSFYRPAESGGGEYSWTTWLVGVEYVEGQPYLAAFVLLRAGI
ncbi:MAG TPA: hypothetical protein VFI11_00335 [Anaerolineales bacterium]|nr:hypothetical protein [Anaerolineales bacterium]